MNTPDDPRLADDDPSLVTFAKAIAMGTFFAEYDPSPKNARMHTMAHDSLVTQMAQFAEQTGATEEEIEAAMEIGRDWLKRARQRTSEIN